MEIGVLSLFAVAACVAAAGWLVASLRLRSTAAEAAALRGQLGKIEVDFGTVREESNSLRDRAAADRARAEASASRVRGLEADLDQLRRELRESSTAHSRLEAKLGEQERNHQEKVEALTAIRTEIGKDLKTITNDSLRDNQSTFLELANEVLDKHKQNASADLEARQKAIEALISPIQTNLAELREAGAQTYGAVSAELKNVVEAQNTVRSETARLVNALRAAPKTRGRWGENTLRNVLELAGLNSYSDFATEQSYVRDGTLSRPDVMIRLPGGRSIVVDAKTSMAAYLDAVDATEDAERERLLVIHAQQLRAQVKQLAGKAYWDGLTLTPDWVVMFVPGENFYAAATERDPGLWEFAARQRVLIVTPATLIALAKTVAYNWRQEKVAENAKRVHELGRDLYKRLATMGGHIFGLGSNLTGAIRKYNDFVGSLESSVMPQARRFNELEVEGASNELPMLTPVEIEPRELRADRDMAVGALARISTPEAA